MNGSAGSRRVGAYVLGFVAVGLGGGGLGAQVVDTAFFNGGQMVQMELFLDSIGIASRARTTGADIEDLLPPDFQLRYRASDGLWVASSQQNSTLEELLGLASAIETDHAEQVYQVGPLGRLDGISPPVALTDQFIVRFHTNVTRAQIDSINQAHQVEIVEQNLFIREIYLLRTVPVQPIVVTVANDYHLSPLTVWATPDLLGGALETETAATRARAGEKGRAGAAGTAHRVPGARAAASEALTMDPFYDKQWHLKNTGQNGGTPGADIDAEGAWTATPGSPATVVAIIENGGFDLDHPDLVGNLWLNPGEAGADEDGNGFINDRHGWDFSTCPTPANPGVLDFTILAMCGDAGLEDNPQYHAVAVAGIIAAETNNSIGVAGICQLCRMMYIRTGSNWYSKVNSFLYAQKEGASVINASWAQLWNQPIADAIQHAADNGRGGKGSLVVFSVFNNLDKNECSGTWKTFAAMPVVTSVSATNNHDVRVTNTDWGPCLDLMAPGGSGTSAWGITTTDEPGDPGYNNDEHDPSCTIPELIDRSYTVCAGGTSMAAPMVSGVAGLILSLNSTLSRSQVHDVLIHTADKVNCPPVVYTPPCSPPDPLSFSDRYGFGRVNAAAALDHTRDVHGVSLPPVTPQPVAPSTFEMGFRMGATWRTGQTNDRTLTNAPGGGPAGEPAFYIAWISGGAANWMVESQFGFSRIEESNPTRDSNNLVAALQPTYLVNLGTGQIYLGLSGAVQNFDSSTGGSFTAWGTGVAVGYRYRPVPQLALRFEGRFRSWSANQPDELGLAFGLGVVLP